MKIKEQLCQLASFLNAINYKLVWKQDSYHIISNGEPMFDNPDKLSLEQVVSMHNMITRTFPTKKRLFVPRTGKCITLHFTKEQTQKALLSKARNQNRLITLQRYKGGLKLSDE